MFSSEDKKTTSVGRFSIFAKGPNDVTNREIDPCVSPTRLLKGTSTSFPKNGKKS